MPLDVSPLRKALASLARGLDRALAARGDEELRDACIQRFEFSFELSWKLLRRQLAMDLASEEGVESLSKKGLFREGGARGLLDEVEPWFRFLELRNLTSHTYEATIAQEVFEALPAFLQHARRLLERLEARRED